MIFRLARSNGSNGRSAWAIAAASSRNPPEIASQIRAIVSVFMCFLTFLTNEQVDFVNATQTKENDESGLRCRRLEVVTNLPSIHFNLVCPGINVTLPIHNHIDMTCLINSDGIGNADSKRHRTVFDLAP